MRYHLFCIIIFLNLIFAANAQQSDADIKKALQGEWKACKAEGDLLYQNDYPDNLPIFYGDTIDNQKFFADNGKSAYKGTKTTFEIVKGEFRVFDPYKEKWSTYKLRLGYQGDSMTIYQSRKNYVTYKKLHYVLDTMPTLDTIIMEGYYFPGTVMLSSDGKVKFLGKEIRCGMVSEGKARDLMNNFRKADIKNIKSKFDNCDDCSNEYITFIQNGKIYKEIRIHGSAPPELDAALNQMQILYYGIKTTNPDTSKLPMGYMDYTRRWWVGRVSILMLNPDETMLLYSYLLNARKTDTPFKVQAYINDTITRTGNMEQIETDGQFFRFTYSGQKPFTLDLGFNFFERNAAILGYRKN